MIKVNVTELVGKNAISMQSGTKLYKVLYPVLIAGDNAEVNFAGVSLFASPFFNASIGLLLKDISIDSLMKNMTVIELNEIGRHLLNDVIQNALSFYSKENKLTKILDDSSLNKGNNGNDNTDS